ncbi:H-type small acid-soluble spore protein [Paenibacillus melissococcoides]|uniref:H-type small acid-soluble spore protein n=1 Tax=Paenibacillus melissococcoides TaxID=2912268 RepID=A0ABM9FYQ4_9BACL|nr:MULTISPECIES: H-type small acid-soluble spore protein [Paenibacillus]MEB9893402.1 H-type small acid-soluble spore protein [Bacillus cereus]CAH8244383.1 H-type small acid-soluble spore protein [Paenibacillus melissococcoides]CAH8703318.1 H-type small acid-soluble spore protein [Paenibacillus melissococcoides]CAH8705684.1 H-type small acid-soluble spore protein [Paenibacillus melissococcoides]GIO80816.1 small, acid-soluble spore protein H [Paenibacillus dendritiformis]
MNTQRAIEISSSPVMTDVTYQGEPVYIQHVNEEDGMARIYPLSNPEDERDVPVSMLIER